MDSSFCKVVLQNISYLKSINKSFNCELMFQLFKLELTFSVAIVIE
jgi:hypothetical protein